MPFLLHFSNSTESIFCTDLVFQDKFRIFSYFAFWDLFDFVKKEKNGKNMFGRILDFWGFLILEISFDFADFVSQASPKLSTKGPR